MHFEKLWIPTFFPGKIVQLWPANKLSLARVMCKLPQKCRVQSVQPFFTFIRHKKTNGQTDRQAKYIDKEAGISVCLFGCPTTAHEPIDWFASNFDWGTR